MAGAHGGFRRCSDAQSQACCHRLVCGDGLHSNALAVKALKIFNERNIDDLIVVNAQRKPAGLVDSRTLPKLKVV
jgi:hypothetical protein